MNANNAFAGWMRPTPNSCWICVCADYNYDACWTLLFAAAANEQENFNGTLVVLRATETPVGVARQRKDA